MAVLITQSTDILKNLTNTKDILIALAILIIVISVGSWAGFIFFKEKHEIQCQTCVDNMKKSVDDLKKNLNSVQEILKLVKGHSGTDYEALVPYIELQEIESSIENKGEIWVSTDDLGNEETRLKETIFQNIKKEIKYVYFIPKDSSETFKKRLVHLFNEGVQKSGKSIEHTNKVLHLYDVPKHFCYMDFVIYNPSTEKQIVLILLPQNNGTGDELYYRVPKGQTKNYVESLNQLASGNKFCNNVKSVTIEEYYPDKYEKVTK